MSDRKNPWADPEAVRAHKRGCQIAARRRSKYNAKPQAVGNLNFDSKREAKRWFELQIRLRKGEISKLERQVTYVLAPSVKIEGEKRARPALRYKADFRYVEGGQTIVSDAKGYADTAFRIRQHLMKSVHGIDVRLS